MGGRGRRYRHGGHRESQLDPLGSRVLEWPNHHALDQCDVGAAMCCTTSSRDSSGANPNSEICYVDMAASRRSARVNDGYSIYGQDQTNDVYCEAFAWGTDEGSI